MAAAKKGDRVKVHYTGRLEDGSVFDSSLKSGPFEFTVGAGELIRDFDECAEGMAPGEKRSVTVPCERAYGQYLDYLVIDIPKEQIPDDAAPVPGGFLHIKNAGGETMTPLILEVTDSCVKVDFNHPLAGKTLVFDIEMLDISARQQAEK